MPMCHDFEDPIFQHVMSMVQKSIAHHIKYPREVNNFAANNYKNEWYIFDNQEGNKEFADKLQQSYEYLKGKNKLSRSFTE